MATLTALQLADMRKFLRENWITAIDFDKPTINAGFQALENEYERSTSQNRPGFEAAGAADVATVVSPKVFTNPELKKIGAAYLKVKVNL